MIQRGKQFCFTLEAGDTIGISRKLFRQHLDRHIPPELLIFSLMDLSHTAFAELFHYYIMRRRFYPHRCEVVGPENKPIPGLYSAGELGSFWGWMYNGGGNNAEALCTGRIAARNSMI